jgi:hypothetical protein
LPFWGVLPLEGLHGYPRRDDAPEGVSAATVAILAATGTETFQVSDVWKSIMNYTTRNAALGLARDGVLKREGGMAATS